MLCVNNLVPMQDQFMNHTWTQALEIHAAVILPWFVYICWRMFSPFRVHKKRHNSNKMQIEVFQKNSHRNFYRAIVVVLVLFVLARALVVCWVAYQKELLDLPLRIHSMNWFETKMNDTTAAFYSYIYLPSWMRMTSYIVGVCVGWIYYHQIWWKPSSVVSVCFACLGLIVSVLPRLTSHSTDTSYPLNLTVIWITIHRLVFGVALGFWVTWLLSDQRRLSNGKLVRENKDSDSDEDADKDDGEEVTEKTVDLIICDSMVASVQRFLSWSGWHYLSSYSYMAYLLHVLVVGGVNTFLKNDNPLTNFVIFRLSVVSFVLTFMASFIAHWYVERPLLNVIKKKIL